MHKLRTCRLASKYSEETKLLNPPFFTTGCVYAICLADLGLVRNVYILMYGTVTILHCIVFCCVYMFIEYSYVHLNHITILYTACG